MNSINDIPPSVFRGSEHRLSEAVMDRLWDYIAYAKERDDRVDHLLAGHITCQLRLKDINNWFWNDTCVPIVEQYKDRYDKGNDRSESLQAFWVNFQNKHEFNPIHAHDGFLSFVIFMQIPYDWKIPIFNCKPEERSAGNFEALYLDVDGIHPDTEKDRIYTYTYHLDSSAEGLMVVFPSHTPHLVYPFYKCEEERITIAGNIAYDI
jgi:hypothetical protein